MFGTGIVLSDHQTEYEEVKKKMEEDLPVVARKMVSWDKTKRTYKAFKLSRRDDAHVAYNPYGASNGALFSGLDCQAGVHLTDAAGDLVTEWQTAEGFIPVNRKCVMLQASKYNSGDSYLRTSLIVDNHIVGSGQVPEWADANLTDGLGLKEGDILLKTLNSFYLLKAEER